MYDKQQTLRKWSDNEVRAGHLYIVFALLCTCKYKSIETEMNIHVTANYRRQFLIKQFTASTSTCSCFVSITTFELLVEGCLQIDHQYSDNNWSVCLHQQSV